MADDIIHQETLAQMGGKVNKLCTAILEWLPRIEEGSCRNLPSKREISDQIERFELWAVNLGLYHAGHSSIDYRFRDSVPLFEYTFQLLQDAENDLMHYLAAGKVREAVADDLNLKLPEINTNSEDDEDDVSSSDDEEFEAGEDLLSFQGVSLPQAYFASFTTRMDRLYRLAFRVRNPAMRVGLSSAISYVEVDEDTKIDLIKQYSVLDHNHIIDLFCSYYPEGAEIPPSLEENYLVKRLAEANTRRRQQFRYWRKRKDQFIAHSVPERVTKDEPAIDQKIQPEAKIPKENVHSSGLSEPSTATGLGEGAHNVHHDTLSVVSTSTFMVMTKGKDSDKVSTPPPPSIPETAKEFECPFCFTMCPRKTFLGRAWETHIFHDLRPFVCTYKDCREGERQYGSFSDWVAHETGKHPALGGTSFLSNNHQGEIDPKRECPICPAKEVNAVHVASHLRRIASFALPAWVILPETDSGASGDAVACPDSSSRHLSDNEDLITADGMVCPGKRDSRISRPTRAPNVYVCPLCGDEFTKKQDLRRHLQTRNPPRLYLCPFYDFQHARKDKAKKHLLDAHPHESTGPYPQLLTIETDQIFPESCSIGCGRNFGSWNEWFDHLFIYHLSTVVAPRPIEGDLLAPSSQEAEVTELASAVDPRSLYDPEATPLVMGPTPEPLLGQNTSDISPSPPIDKAQEGAAFTEDLCEETIEESGSSKVTR